MNPKREININNHYDYDLANNFNELAGGINQEWVRDLEKSSKKFIEYTDPFGKDMGELQYVIKNFNRLNCPITLNPKDSTFLDVAIWSYYQKRLSISTIEKRLRYARFMRDHDVSVDFNNPNYENFRRHMDYREEIEKASPHALKHEWKTMRMFLEAYGIPIWPYKPPYAPKAPQRLLPFPDIVREFFYYDYSKDSYEKALYQYLFFHGYMIGWRVPSEIIEMRIDDVIIDSKGRGSIAITETKKHKDKRVILPEKHILSSQSHKSMKNWIDKWRPKVENQYSGNSLYLQPSGKPFTIQHLGHKLRKNGRKIWPYFRPYDMRHWCAVSRLIESKIQTGSFGPYSVKNWLGHTDLKTTESYIHYAEMYYNQCKMSWIQNALRSHKIRRGKHEGLQSKRLMTNCQNKATLPNFSPVERYGPAEIRTRVTTTPR